MQINNDYLNIEAILKDVKFKEEKFLRKEEICQSILDYIENDKRKRLRARHFIMRSLATAAVAIVVFVTGAYWAMNTTVTSGQDVMAIVLPDNSDVVMQPQTSIKYNRLAWVFKRDLSLEGCAEFSVTHGSTFTVNTALGDISVLGTRFMVDVTSDELVVECYEGSVSVKTKAGKKVLTKDQKLHFDGEETTPGVVWPEFIEFENESLPVVLSKIEEIYDVVFADKNSFANIEYSGFIVTGDMEETLDLLSITCDIDFNVNGNQISIIVP